LGRKWSVYYEHLLRGLFRGAGKEIEVDAMENQLVVRIKT